MATIRVITTDSDYVITTLDGESLMETLRRNNVPVSSVIVTTGTGRNLVSVTHRPAPREQLTAYSLRNVDFGCVMPRYAMLPPDGEMAAEIIRPMDAPKNLAVVQYSRVQAIAYIQQAFDTVLDAYRSRLNDHSPIQISLSAGGDSRVLAECAAEYARKSGCVFECLTIGVGVEGEEETLRDAAAIARAAGLSHQVIDSRAGAHILGLRGNLRDTETAYREVFPQDEPEILGTFWIQQINFAVARQAGRRAIVFGFNQEDVVAERLFHMMTASTLPPLPIRRLEDFDVIAPLGQVPKKLLDAMDLQNSLRNYRLRRPSVSYLRSSLYFLAYTVCENFPALADVLSGTPLNEHDSDDLTKWLSSR